MPSIHVSAERKLSGLELLQNYNITEMEETSELV